MSGQEQNQSPAPPPLPPAKGKFNAKWICVSILLPLLFGLVVPFGIYQMQKKDAEHKELQAQLKLEAEKKIALEKKKKEELKKKELEQKKLEEERQKKLEEQKKAAEKQKEEARKVQQATPQKPSPDTTTFSTNAASGNSIYLPMSR